MAETEASTARLARLPRAGAIEGGTPFRLYALIASEKRTGRLSLHGPSEISFELSFRQGNPEQARTSDPELSQEQYLISKSLVRAEELRALAVQEGREIEALVAKSRLTPHDAFKYLGGYYRALLVRALLLEDGRFEWTDGQPRSGGIQLGDRWALLTAVGRRIPFPSLERRLGPRLAAPIWRDGADLDLQWESLGLNAVETRALSRFNGTRSLADLAAAHQEEALPILQLGCFLAEAGLVSFGERDEQGRPPGQANAQQSVRQELDETKERLAQMEAADFFQRLGVDRGASDAQVRRAYLALARTFHPDVGGPRGELRRVREQITALLNEAYETLGAAASRAGYLEDLESGGAEKVDISSILEADRLLHIAAALVRERRFEEALVRLEEALGLHDEEGEAWAYRAYATFASASDKRAVAAACLADLERARALNDRSSTVFLMSARVANLLDDSREAIRYYERCLELEPGNLDARRELRLLMRRAK